MTTGDCPHGRIPAKCPDCQLSAMEEEKNRLVAGLEELETLFHSKSDSRNWKRVREILHPHKEEDITELDPEEKISRLKSLIEVLRSALVVQCNPHNYGMKRGELCWCSKDYDVEAYGHSIACVSAKEALQYVTKDYGKDIGRLRSALKPLAMMAIHKDTLHKFRQHWSNLPSLQQVNFARGVYQDTCVHHYRGGNFICVKCGCIDNNEL